MNKNIARRLNKTPEDDPQRSRPPGDPMTNTELVEKREGTRKRFRSTAERLRHLLEALEGLVEDELPNSAQRQAVVMTAVELGNHAAVLDALTFLSKS